MPELDDLDPTENVPSWTEFWFGMIATALLVFVFLGVVALVTHGPLSAQPVHP